MIDQVVAPDDIDSLTRLVLVNAVYFKGLWKSRFRPENTKKRPFHGADGKIYQVPMLSQLSIFRCGEFSNSHLNTLEGVVKFFSFKLKSVLMYLLWYWRLCGYESILYW